MTIHRFLQNVSFGPDEIRVLVDAYECALRALRLKQRSDPITELVAKKIVEIGQRGFRDAAQIAALALQELGHQA
jgi:hypothetical protein